MIVLSSAGRRDGVSSGNGLCDMASIRHSGPIAILGATSHLARDFIRTARTRITTQFYLYARDPDTVTAFLVQHGLEKLYPVRALRDFGHDSYAAIINFIGVGDPARVKAIGADIFSATLNADRMVLDYLLRWPATTYIFTSSGAVYGTDFSIPVTESSRATVPVNDLQPQDYYSVAKLYAEALHRACLGYTIFDIRIFNYISRTISLSTRFLITDMINAVLNGTLFKTDNSIVFRDFLHPQDFCRLIEASLAAPAGTNLALDAYSQGPISKEELLILMSAEFGLRYEIVPASDTLHATGDKPYYFSTNRRAATLGYEPTYSSKRGIIEEVRAILADRN